MKQTFTPDARPVHDGLEAGRRRIRVDGWSVERQRLFLQLLADMGSVQKAADMVGMSVSSAYALRRDPRALTFRNGWELAMREAMRQCAEVALERALYGVDVPVWYKGQMVGEIHKLNDKLLMQVLRYGDRARREDEASDLAEEDRYAYRRREGNLEALQEGLIQAEAAPVDDIDAIAIDRAVAIGLHAADTGGDSLSRAAARRERRAGKRAGIMVRRRDAVPGAVVAAPALPDAGDAAADGMLEEDFMTFAAKVQPGPNHHTCPVAPNRDFVAGPNGLDAAQLADHVAACAAWDEANPFVPGRCAICDEQMDALLAIAPADIRAHYAEGSSSDGPPLTGSLNERKYLKWRDS
ncbi:hypothetical protein [Glacieibacterium sp.]|uniref:hypothetical protein n=1 Tax=Glacieibacterium sp. TaxID=2860237 RepID=UPI003AFF9608